MTRSAQRRDDLAPSLFPFLAVLLCTIGALVLILMLSVSGAQSSTQLLVDEMEEQVEFEQAKIQLVKVGLTDKLDEMKIQVEKRKLALQHIEEHIRELTDELKQLQEQTKLTLEAKENSKSKSPERENLISELEQQLADAKKELQNKLENPTGDKPIFAIIPYEGSYGTHRRPIYLECTERGVVIQPEGVLVKPADLRPPYGPGNPLDAALRTIRAEYPSTTGSVTSNPYPLLVVRPSGIKHYMMARAAMTGWDDQFGYELVSEELELVYPPSLPNLPEKIVQALELARQRQAALVQAMPQHYAGLEPSTEELALMSENDFPDSHLASGVRSNQGEFGIAQDSRVGSANQLPNSETALAGSNQFGNAINSLGVPEGLRDAGMFDSGSSGPVESAAEMNLTPYGTNQPLGGGSQDSLATGSTELDGTDGGQNSAGNGSSNSGQATGGGAEMAAASSSTFQPPNMGSQPTQNGAGQAMGSGSNESNPSASSSNFGPNSADQPPESASQTVSANLNLNGETRQLEMARPVALARGSNWAWDRPPRTQTAIVRAIRLRCYLDRWEVLPDGQPNKNPIIIRFEGTPPQRAERLATVVRQRVETWGVALANGYWTPVLHVDVASDAQWRFTQLQRLMEGSGIDVQKKNTIPPVRE